MRIRISRCGTSMLPCAILVDDLDHKVRWCHNQPGPDLQDALIDQVHRFLLIKLHCGNVCPSWKVWSRIHSQMHPSRPCGVLQCNLCSRRRDRSCLHSRKESVHSIRVLKQIARSNIWVKRRPFPDENILKGQLESSAEDATRELVYIH